MGRNKLDLKKIENATSRQVTYSKRRNGLLKKAYELSVLCDVDVALIAFSPSGRLSHFSGNKRIEEVFSRLINLPARLRDFPIENKEYIETILDVLRRESDMSSSNRNNIEKLEEEIQKTKEQLEVTMTKLREFEPDVGRALTMRDVEASEKKLYATLTRIQARKNNLLFGPSPDDEFAYEAKGGQPLTFGPGSSHLNVDPFSTRPHWRSFVSAPNEIPINGVNPFGNDMSNGYMANQAPLQYVGMQQDYQAPFPLYPTMQGMEGYQMNGMVPHQQMQISPEFMDVMGNNAPQLQPYQQEGEDAAHFNSESNFLQGNMDHQNLQIQPYAHGENPIEGFQGMYREDLHMMEMDNQVDPIDNNPEDFDEGMWPYELHPRRLPNWVDSLPPMYDENWLEQVHSPSNSQAMVPETSSHFSATSPSIYDPAYQGMGLHVDPHLRVYNSSQSDSGSSGLPPWDYVATSSAIPTELVPPGFEMFKKDRVPQWVSTDAFCEEEISNCSSNMRAL